MSFLRGKVNLFNFKSGSDVEKLFAYRGKKSLIRHIDSRLKLLFNFQSDFRIIKFRTAETIGNPFELLERFRHRVLIF